MLGDTMSTLGFVACCALIVGVKLWRLWRDYLHLPTFDEYRELHPGLVNNGRCRCHKCGGGRVFLHSLDAYRRRHICATCSTLLYRS